MRLVIQEALVACFLLTIPATTAYGIHNRAMTDDCFQPDDTFDGPNYEYPCDENVESGYNTRAPTMAPSDLPSVAPSGFPSSSPSDSPSGFPSSSPSNSPSGSPSSPPTYSPTSIPSISPSLMPSNSPTLSGSPTSSQPPSSSPAPSLTDHPNSLPEQCVSSFGVFGDISWTRSVVNFGYELEISEAGIDIEELILPDLEVAMVDSVLSGLFPVGCSETGTRKLQLQRRLEVEGISGSPDDIIFDDISCKTQLDSGNTCVVVSGQMTLYADGDSNAEAVLLQAILEKNMENGTYVNGQIARVSYVQLDASPNGQQNDIDGSQVRDGGGSGDGITVGLGLGLAAAGAAIVAIAGVLYTRRNKFQDDENTTMPPNVNSYSNLEEANP